MKDLPYVTNGFTTNIKTCDNLEQILLPANAVIRMTIFLKITSIQPYMEVIMDLIRIKIFTSVFTLLRSMLRNKNLDKKTGCDLELHPADYATRFVEVNILMKYTPLKPH